MQIYYIAAIKLLERIGIWQYIIFTIIKIYKKRNNNVDEMSAYIIISNNFFAKQRKKEGVIHKKG